MAVEKYYVSFRNGKYIFICNALLMPSLNIFNGGMRMTSVSIRDRNDSVLPENLILL